MRRNDITPRVLAMILAAATLFSTVSTVAFANEEIEVTSQQSEIEVPEEVVQEETAESQPVEPQPGETQPTQVEPQPIETQPEIQPMETQPTGTEPETQPAESQPTEMEVIPETTVEETPETTAEPTTESVMEEMSEAAEESSSLIERAREQGKEAAEKIISAAKESVSTMLESLLEAVPGGGYIKSLFDFLTGVLGDEIIGNIWEETADIDVIIGKLEEIQEDLRQLSGQVIELQNATFKNAINEVHRISEMYIDRLITYNKAVSELKKEPEGSERITELEQNVVAAKSSLVSLASNPDISQTLRSNLTISIQYMANKTLGGEADNPFLINLNAKINEGYTFGTDLLAEQRKFDETVWKFFTEGLTLYTACMEINASVTDNSEDARLIAQSLAELLTGSSDGTQSVIGQNVLGAIEYYNTTVRQKENEFIGQYRTKRDDKEYEVAKFKVLTNANISKGKKITITNGTYNSEAEMYIANLISSPAYDAYFSDLNTFIKEEYLGKYSSYTLRSFLTKKLGVTVPEESKYLMLSKIRSGGRSFGTDMSIIALDETNTSIQHVFWTLDNTELDNVCFFTESMNPIENREATITLPDGRSFSFTTFEQAWNATGRFGIGMGNITVTLYKDVTAEKNGEENFTRFAYGDNFTSTENEKTVYGAIKVSRPVTVDLNGHTINRNQDVAVAGGSVFILDSDAQLTLKNGTIIGGNTTGNGGAITSIAGGTSINLDNMILTGNHANGYGGAVYYDNNMNYMIKDTTITNNTAGKNGGGIYCASYGGINTADIVAKGTIVIWDNTVNGKANNATLTDSGAKKTIFKLHDSFSKNSKIGVNSTTTDKWLDITNGCDLSKDCKDCFSADNENQSLECYKSKVLKNWYICIWNNK